MEVHFTIEQEAQLAQIASRSGTDPERLVKDAALRLLAEEARFRDAVQGEKGTDEVFIPSCSPLHRKRRLFATKATVSFG